MCGVYVKWNLQNFSNNNFFFKQKKTRLECTVARGEAYANIYP